MVQAGLNLIGQALSIYGADLRLVVCNRPFQRMFDLPHDLVSPGARFDDTIRFLVERGEYGPVQNPDQFVADRVAQAQAFEPHYVERTRAGGMVISIEGAPLPEGGWVAVYTDITATKHQERLLRARSEELSDQLLARAEALASQTRALASANAALEEARRQATEQEARTRLTTEMMPAHIARLGPDRTYTYSNRRLSSVLPDTPRDIIGLDMETALGSEAWTRIAPHLDRAYAGDSDTFEFTHAPSSRRIRVSFTPEMDGAQVQGVYVLSMDVTEETQARIALAQAAQRQVAAQLTSGMAHDFANLLTVILALHSKLARQDLDAEAQDLVTAIGMAAKRGGSLLDQIANLSGERTMHPTPVRLTEWLQEIALLARPSLPKGMRLDWHTDLTAPYVFDPDALRDAALNLILNARDAMGDTGRIQITARNIRDTWLELAIEDTGPGFTEEALDKGLTPFFTTKGDDGTGLGLSMVYDIVKLGGGRVTLGRASLGGAEVRLRLPLREAPPGLDPTLILLVEDAAHIREAVRDTLVSAGHSVLEAASVDDARRTLDIEGLGLVLTDIMLKTSDTGLDLAADASAKNIPVALMTSLPPDAPLYQKAQGRWPIVRKPFTLSALEAAL